MRTATQFTVFILLITMSISCERTMVNNTIIEKLPIDWELSQSGSEEWIPATMPGSVHTALLAAGKIEDPFYRLNEHDIQWIDKKDWVYRSSFNLSKSILMKDQVEIVFPGLDTYASVWINDSLVLEADNMFREWLVDAKDILKTGKNTIKIVFRSPIEVGLEKYDALPYVIPVSDNDLAEIGQVEEAKKVSVFTRKAGYHFGWDWGPRLVTSGIWKPAYIRAWDLGMIKDVQIVQHEIGKEKALLKAIVEVQTASLGEGEILISVNGNTVAQRKINADEITVFAEIPFEIENPELWWPNGMGDQVLYDVRVELKNEGNSLHQVAERIGLRTIELVTDPDEAGSTFHFRVNGRPVFMKGANYIPQDSFLDRVTPERYAHVIQSAVDGNMNMLRVWGGGIYEKDIFYDMCDEKGILIWQDFMFACAMFPGDDAFLENVRQEAIDNVKRLRNHPSIALWCGNNENLSAWHRWGWKEKAIEEQGQEVADIIWKAYEDVFHKILPEVIKNEDAERSYWSSSSSADFGVPDNLTQGDLHYWGVWWGKEPFSSFKENTGRFMSEYGFQSFPEMKTINEYATKADWDIYSDVMKSHQRSSIGNETIELYMKRDYNEPIDFPSFIYVGQILQGEGIKRAIELHRVQMPYCMGSLFWQIDDCWPVASWSGMDYFGRWKAQHYFARDAFKNVILVPQVDKDKTFINTVSDLPVSFTGVLNCKLMDFSGNIIMESESNVEVKANTSAQVNSFGNKIDGFIQNEVLLLATLTSDGKEIDRAIWYYAAPKDLKLTEPSIVVRAEKKGESDFSITVKSDVLAKNVFLETETDGFFSDNYFDVLPGESHVLTFQPAEDISELEFEIKDLTSSYK